MHMNALILGDWSFTEAWENNYSYSYDVVKRLKDRIMQVIGMESSSLPEGLKLELRRPAGDLCL